jgi:hypothetical protein
MNVAELVAKLGFEVDTKELTKFADGLESVAGLAAKVGAGIAAAAAAATYALIRTAESVDEVADSARRLGISTNALIELNHAAEKTDTSAESLAQGLKFISKNAVEAAQGSKEAKDAFAKIGVQVKDANGKFKSADVLLEDVAEGFQSLPEGVERTNLALKLFGRGGIEMVTMLAAGKQGIRDLRQEATLFGLTLSAKTEKDVASFDDSMKDLKAATAGAFKQMLKALPDLERIIKILTAGFAKFRPQIDRAVGILGKLFKITGSVLEVFINLFSKVELISTFTAALAAMVPILAVLALKFMFLNATAVAAAISAGVAWAGFFASVLVPAALLFLIFDELFAYFEGRPSFFGDFLHFLDQASSNPFFEYVKASFALLFDLFNPARWQRLFVSIGGMLDSTILAPLRAVAKLAGIDISAASAIKSFTTPASATASLDDAQVLKTQAAMRQAEAVYTPGPSGRSVSSSATTVAPVININGSGLSGEELQSRVENALSSTISSALPAVR